MILLIDFKMRAQQDYQFTFWSDLVISVITHASEGKTDIYFCGSLFFFSTVKVEKISKIPFQSLKQVHGLKLFQDSNQTHSAADDHLLH